MVTDKRIRTNRYPMGKANSNGFCKSCVLVFTLSLLTGITEGQETDENTNQDIAPNLQGGAASVESAENDDFPIALKKQRAAQTALAEAVEQSEIIWLNTRYPGADEQEKTLALKQEVKNPNSHGAVLILPDRLQHADWPGMVRALRNQLPFDGWLTLSINLPWPLLPDQPERSLEAKQQETYVPTPETQNALAIGARPFRSQESVPDTSQADQNSSADPDGDNVDINLTANNQTQDSETIYRERALVHVQAGYDKLEELGYQNLVLLAIGSSAELAIEFVQSKRDSIGNKGFTLILIDSKLVGKENWEFGERLGENFPAPVLDIYDATSRSAEENAKARLVSTQTAQFRNYQSVKLPLTRGSSFQKSLTKRIKDWLEKYAPGESKNR